MKAYLESSTKVHAEYWGIQQVQGGPGWPRIGQENPLEGWAWRQVLYLEMIG